MTPEKEIQNAVMSYLHSLSKENIAIHVERRQAGGFAYKIGLPDLWAIVFGKHIEIEVKRPGGKLRATQEKWAKRFKEIGVEYICVDNIDSLKELINKLKVEYISTNKEV